MKTPRKGVAFLAFFTLRALHHIELTTQEELQKMWILRKIIHPMGEIDAMEFLINKLAMTKTNDDFFDMMKRS